MESIPASTHVPELISGLTSDNTNALPERDALLTPDADGQLLTFRDFEIQAEQQQLQAETAANLPETLLGITTEQTAGSSQHFCECDGPQIHDPDAVDLEETESETLLDVIPDIAHALPDNELDSRPADNLQVDSTAFETLPGEEFAYVVPAAQQQATQQVTQQKATLPHEPTQTEFDDLARLPDVTKDTTADSSSPQSDGPNIAELPQTVPSDLVPETVAASEQPAAAPNQFGTSLPDASGVGAGSVPEAVVKESTVESPLPPPVSGFEQKPELSNESAVQQNSAQQTVVTSPAKSSLATDSSVVAAAAATTSSGVPTRQKSNAVEKLPIVDETSTHEHAEESDFISEPPLVTTKESESFSDSSDMAQQNARFSSPQPATNLGSDLIQQQPFTDPVSSDTLETPIPDSAAVSVSLPDAEPQIGPLTNVPAAPVDSAPVAQGSQPIITTTNELSDVLKTQIEIQQRTPVDNEPVEIQIRFDPPKLGRVRLVVTQIDEEVNVRVYAVSPMTLDVIENDLPAIREAVDLAGVQIGEFHIEQEAPNQHSAQQSQRDVHGSKTRESSDDAVDANEQPAPNLVTNRLLDVVA